MLLRLLQWPLCGDWSQATPPSSRTKRCASSLWQLDFSPDEVCLPFKYEPGVATLRRSALENLSAFDWGLVMTCELRPEMLDDIQAHYSTLHWLGSNTGASFQTMRELLSAAFPSTQLYYFLQLSTFVNEPFRSKAQKLLAQVLRKRQVQVPTTMTQLLLPPLHVRDWKAQLGTWLQRWVVLMR